MIKGKTVLGVIPARGGSKRLPGKNIINLRGKPLIVYTIYAGKRSKYIDELIVSTDDPKISDIAVKYGAKVPFIRPKYLSNDRVITFDVIKHALEYYRNSLGKEFHYVALLQPTSPLRDVVDIDNAFDLLIKKNADSVISVCESEHSPLWSNTLPPNLSMSGFLSDEIINKRSQDLDTYYRLNGAIYICKSDRLMQEKTFFLNDNVFALIMPREKSVDVDTIIDLKLCEILIKESLVQSSN